MNALIEAKEAKKWLNQFSLENRATAQLLLDSIIIISNTELIENLTKTLEEFSNNMAKGKIALFVVREVEENMYFSENSSPNRINGLSGVGSEGLFAHLIRDISRKNPNFLDHPSITQMRKEKCRHIFCIDDIIGSGKRSRNFCNWLYDDKTIKSWCSLGYIDINVCAYAVTLMGKSKIEELKFVKTVLFVQAIGSGRSFWTSEQRDNIIYLCKEYGKLTSKKKMPLGFEDSFTLIIFPHKCPNTNPAILWASKPKSWNALFPIRPEFDFSKIFRVNLKDKSFLFKLLGINSFVDSLIYPSLHDNLKIMVAILSKLNKKKYKPEVISEMFNLPLIEVNMIIDTLKSYRWIDDSFKLTKHGKKILHLAQKKKFIKDVLEEKQNFYYPITLRAPVD